MTRSIRVLSRSVTTAAQIFAGAGTALAPISMQAIAARAMDISEQATLALSISVGAFIAGLLSAMILETRLTTTRSRPLSFLPRWSVALGLGGCAAIVFGIVSPIGFMLGAPLTMIALGLGRTHGVITQRWRAESAAGLTMVLGVGSSLFLIHVAWQLAAVALGVFTALTIAMRALRQPGHPLSGPGRAEYVKVGLETSVTSAVPLLLNVLVFALLSSADAVAFRMLLSVLGVLQPLLGLLRTRLLVSKSISLILALGSASIVALACVILAHVLGLLSFILGSTWSVVSTAALALACLWKVSSIPSTLPFAEMRRRGQLDALLGLRVGTSFLFVFSGWLSLIIDDSMFSIFLGLFIAECVNSLLYFTVAHRAQRDPSMKAPS